MSEASDRIEELLAKAMRELIELRKISEELVSHANALAEQVEHISHAPAIESDLPVFQPLPELQTFGDRFVQFLYTGPEEDRFQEAFKNSVVYKGSKAFADMVSPPFKDNEE